MRKCKVFFLVIFGLSLFSSQVLYAQDPDPGIRDTLFVSSSSCNVAVWGYHDEGLGGISIPLKYKNPQTDITLDSVRFHPDMNAVSLKDSIRDDAAGTITLLLVSFGIIPAGVDTFATLYFTTGPTWDPSVHNPIDTFTLISGQGLNYVDTSASPQSIIPHYDPPGSFGRGCTDVKEDHRFPSTLRPNSFVLSQNYPNPFNTETVITFALPRSGNVKIEIFNILGQKVRELVDEKVTAGYKKVIWDGKDNRGKTVASGVYFYRVKADNFVDVKKMTLLK
ncbi:MAG: hypothetical protein RBG1_1C00001G0593 [candidate division Zixibacteria bacterium RBG-1]|nr:MAG: hypothetical protein RBG1_1C00001G0593 [candidate division Zixibacteria bacterium RBG-1]OGC85680.1 MAG: hypothetical protein A2V73_08405 [candidate division Zixibacteria bacterium RBG_19FT_COMBO_42_43]